MKCFMYILHRYKCTSIPFLCISEDATNQAHPANRKEVPHVSLQDLRHGEDQGAYYNVRLGDDAEAIRVW